MTDKHDIEGNLIRQKKQRPKKKKGSVWKEKLITESLENKLPNEFKGSIINYNHYSCGGPGQLDDNQYYC